MLADENRRLLEQTAAHAEAADAKEREVNDLRERLRAAAAREAASKRAAMQNSSEGSLQSRLAPQMLSSTHLFSMQNPYFSAFQKMVEVPRNLGAGGLGAGPLPWASLGEDSQVVSWVHNLELSWGKCVWASLM